MTKKTDPYVRQQEGEVIYGALYLPMAIKINKEIGGNENKAS